VQNAGVQNFGQYVGKIALVKHFNAVKETIGDLKADVAGMVIAASADIALIVDRDGAVLDLSYGEGDFRIEGSDRWRGRFLRDLVTSESLGKVERMLAGAAANERPRWRQINHHAKPGDIPVQYLALPLTTTGHYVVIGREMGTMALLQQKLIMAQQTMERDYERFRHAETRYRLLFQISGEAILVVSARTGKIVEANAAASRILGHQKGDLVGQNFFSGFDEKSTDDIHSLLEQVRTGGTCEDISVKRSDNAHSFFMSANLFTHHKDGLFYLLRLKPVEDNESASMVPRAKARIIEVMEKSPDAFVMTDQQGIIQAANRSFLSLVQLVAEQQVLGQSLDQWLWRPGVGLNVLLGTLREEQTVRLFSTSIRGEMNAVTKVEISAAAATRGDETSYGFVIRDVERRFKEIGGFEKNAGGSNEGMTELVGRVALKDIVRETTDVIERMCIEAALEMTHDNRASAAEMLGLSRQSLYVKMRRYGVGEFNSQDRD
jgi:transcriptional regulator PpsR